MGDVLTKRYWTSTDVKALLQAKFGGGGKHAILFEVGNSTGFDKNRSIDAVTMSLWPSLGLELAGMEIKVSRSDWLRELKDPAKASSTFEYFDRWYLVAPRDVARIDEIPGPWGWLAPEEDKIVTLKQAPLNEKPLQLDRKFLAALLRCESKSDEKLINAAVERAVNAESKRLQELHAARVDSEIERRTDTMKADADKFKELRLALGDSLGWMDNQEIIAAIRMVINTGAHSAHGMLRNLQKQLAKAAASLDESIQKINPSESAPPREVESE